MNIYVIATVCTIHIGTGVRQPLSALRHRDRMQLLVVESGKRSSPNATVERLGLHNLAA